MKVTDVNIDQVLYTEPVRTRPYDSDEETGGFFKKLFKIIKNIILFFYKFFII